MHGADSSSNVSSWSWTTHRKRRLTSTTSVGCGCPFPFYPSPHSTTTFPSALSLSLPLQPAAAAAAMCVRSFRARKRNWRRARQIIKKNKNTKTNTVQSFRSIHLGKATEKPKPKTMPMRSLHLPRLLLLLPRSWRPVIITARFLLLADLQLLLSNLLRLRRRIGVFWWEEWSIVY